MFLIKVSGNRRLPVNIEPVNDTDFKIITKKRYSFNWKLEKRRTVYKLTIKGENDILGLISLDFYDSEFRLEIKLLAVAEEHKGHDNEIDRIAGNLIAFTARLAIKKYGMMAAISLVPKTDLGQYYMDRYGFEQAGMSLFMEIKQLVKLLKEYDHD